MSSPRTREHVVWPKLPFPPHYSWREIRKRADAICNDKDFRAAYQARGPSAFADPYLHIVFAEQATPASPFFEMEWRPGRRDDRFDAQCSYGVMLPLARPAEVVLLVGVAGAEDGSGGPTVQRFVLTLGLFASFSVIAGGEDCLQLKVIAKNEHAATLIAERACQIAPKLGQTDGVMRDILEQQKLTLFW